MTATAARRPSAPPGDELDDIFNYAANMDDVFRDVDTNMRPSAREDNPSQARNTSHTNNADSLGIDEQIKVTKKRAPIPKLDEGRLLSQAGIPKLRRNAKEKLKFKGKGHEYFDAARLLQFYQFWLDDLYPRAKFADGLVMIEKLGHTKRMQTMRREWINQGKPRLNAEESETEAPVAEDVRDGPAHQLQEIGERDGRPRTPALQDPDTDLYSATPREAREQSRTQQKKGAAGESLFLSDDEAGAQPSGDELDALLAENDLNTNAARPPTSTLDSHQRKDDPRREDDFDDEMEAMAGMEDMW